MSEGTIPLSVLIVDDSRVIRMLLRSIFTKNGYEVVGEATTGREAIELYKKLLPDFVTMDINMPDLNGNDAVRAILKLDPDAKVIMISSLGTEEDVMRALDFGALTYISKPFTEDGVLTVLKTVLGDRQRAGND